MRSVQSRRRGWSEHSATLLASSAVSRRESLLALLPRIAEGRRGGAVVGMGLGAFAYFLFALHDACIKLLVVGGIPPWQVLLFRSTLIVAVCLAGGGRRVVERAVATPIKGALLGRAVITLIAWLCYYSAARSLPLAQLLTLYFAAPIVTSLLAVPMLRERVPPLRWVALALGFAGVVVACEPGRLALSFAAVLALTAALFWGYAIILMRQTALGESNLLLMLYTNAVFLVATAVGCAVFGWRVPSGGELALLVAVGVIGAGGQLALFEGMRHAPASIMASVEYTALVWAFVLGFTIWGDIPRVGVFAGAGLILASGVVLIAGERRRE
jgi:drug/metabolite transporter (DMT)-like permease